MKKRGTKTERDKETFIISEYEQDEKDSYTMGKGQGQGHLI